MTGKPRPKVHEQMRPEEIPFGVHFSDHMLICEWTKEEGWKSPRIVPYGDITLSPACIAFHYGCEVNSNININDM